MNIEETEKQPNISYMTYGEIIRLALDKKYGKDDTVINVHEQLEFASQLVIDVNVAIEDREIIPVDIKKSSSYIGNFDYYKDKIMPYFLIAVPLGSIAFIKYLWNKPDLRASVLRDDPGVDVLSMFINIWTIVAVSALVPLLPEVFRYIRVRYLSLKSSNPEGMIKYQLQEAKYRGYTDTGYYTDSVLEFLKSAYGLSAHSEDDFYTSGYDDKCHRNENNHANAWSKNPMLLESGLLKLLCDSLPDKKRQELSEKMKKVGSARYESKYDREGQIRDYILREIPPPCTCCHNHIAKYIYKNANKKEFELSLEYITKQGDIHKIGWNRLLLITKEVVGVFDKSRVPSVPVKESTCTVHPVKKRNN